MDGSLFERGKALEDRFFSERDKQLLDRLKAEIEAVEAKKSLASVCGIDDEAVLDALVAHHITAESMASVSLIPLIIVAWADGKVAADERDAVLQAAEQVGIENGSSAAQLLASWLNEKPTKDLFESWKAYIAAMTDKLEPAALAEIKECVVGRAKKVADAAGGILGFGKTSDSEARVIAELEEAFKN